MVKLIPVYVCSLCDETLMGFNGIEFDWSDNYFDKVEAALNRETDWFTTPIECYDDKSTVFDFTLCPECIEREEIFPDGKFLTIQTLEVITKLINGAYRLQS